jgi:hypothetical protein
MVFETPREALGKPSSFDGRLPEKDGVGTPIVERR